MICIGSVQPVPWKMRLGMIVEMQIEILNGREILVNESKSKNSNSSVSRGTNSNWDFDWIWIPLYLPVQIQIVISVLQLTKISPQFRISICISTTIPSLIFHGTGCTSFEKRHFGRAGPQIFYMIHRGGRFSRTRFKCSFTVVNPPLYCTGKWSCKMTCTSAMSQLQLPCNGSTGQVLLQEHEIFHGTPRTCSIWYIVVIVYHLFFACTRLSYHAFESLLDITRRAQGCKRAGCQRRQERRSSPSDFFKTNWFTVHKRKLLNS